MTPTFRDVPDFFTGEVILEFWPSELELGEASDNKYAGSLGPFHDSVQQLDTHLRDMWYQSLDEEAKRHSPTLRTYTSIYVERGEHVSRALPPLLAELVMHLGTGGLALALYKMLHLWVNHRNGRRIKVKTLGIELEATQLTPEEFERLFESLAQSARSMATREKLLMDLTDAALPVEVRPQDNNERRSSAQRLQKQANLGIARGRNTEE